MPCRLLGWWGTFTGYSSHNLIYPVVNTSLTFANGLGPAVGLVVVFLALAAGYRFRSALALVFRECLASLSLAKTIDGRHALFLAWGLRRSAWRLRGMVAAVEDDPARRHALTLALRRFTRGDLPVLLTRLSAMLATGDNDRVRELNRALEEASSRWALLPDSDDRQRIEANMASLRQRMEESRRVSRAWVGMIRSLEETGRVMKELERDLALLGVSRSSQLPEVRRRLTEISTRLQDLRGAYEDLSIKH